ncbi:hypothetical protein JTB14_037635 [Gonioctena quinquepunctata]|nr:hypothetical protein JTB14_037635 [Gonioctena quinquepunctata]
MLGLINRATINEILMQTKEELLTKFKVVFSGIGKIVSEPINLKLKSNYETSVVPCRKVPFQLMGKLKDELKKMCKDEIIVKVTEPTEFVNPITIVKKVNNQIRICLDPQKLNQAILREHYELPIFDELVHEMNGSCFFSVLDAFKGFWQISLSNEASKLTTFATPFGRY